MLFAYHADFDGNEAQNILLETITPSGGVEKQVGYHPDQYLTYHNGVEWVRLVGKYSETVGDGVNKIFTVNHNLNTEDVTVSVFDVLTKQLVLAKVNYIDIDNVQIEVSKTDNYRVVVTG